MQNQTQTNQTQTNQTQTNQTQTNQTQSQKTYYLRKCISCLNKVTLEIPIAGPRTEGPCPRCQATVRIWP